MSYKRKMSNMKTGDMKWIQKFKKLLADNASDALYRVSKTQYVHHVPPAEQKNKI